MLSLGVKGSEYNSIATIYIMKLIILQKKEANTHRISRQQRFKSQTTFHILLYFHIQNGLKGESWRRGSHLAQKTDVARVFLIPTNSSPQMGAVPQHGLHTHKGPTDFLDLQPTRNQNERDLRVETDTEKHNSKADILNIGTHWSCTVFINSIATVQNNNHFILPFALHVSAYLRHLQGLTFLYNS